MKWEVLVWIDSYGQWSSIGRTFARRDWAHCYASILNCYALTPGNYVYRAFPVS